jgi:hypothetical protein
MMLPDPVLGILGIALIGNAGRSDHGNFRRGTDEIEQRGSEVGHKRIF